MSITTTSLRKPRFVSVLIAGHPVYAVYVGHTLAGTVEKREHPFYGVYWVARYNDGTVTGTSHDRRIDAAWALILS